MGLSWTDVAGYGLAGPLYGAYKAADPSGAYNDAAGKVTQLGDKAMDLGAQSWGKQMGGLDRAMGAYYGPGGSKDSISQYGSYASTPGRMENGFDAYGSNFLQPGTQSGLYGQLSQRYGSAPTNSQGAYNNLPGTLGPNNSAGVFGSMYGGPSQREQAFGQVGGSLLGSSQSQQGYSNTFGGVYGQPTQGEGYASRNLGYFGQSGMLEQQAGGLAGQAQGSANPLGTAFQTTASGFGNLGADTSAAMGQNRTYQSRLQNDIEKSGQRYDQPGQLAQMSGDIKGAYNSANDVQGFAQRQGGNFEKQGMGEQFAQSFLDQENPYQQREQKKLTDSMNQQFAARGVFNSGGAIAGLGNALGEFQAQNYKNMADVSAQGQQMQMQRLGQGQGLAQASSGEKQALGSNLQGLGQGLSQEWLGRDSNRLADRQGLTQNALGLMGMNLHGANQLEQSKAQGLQGYMQGAGSLSNANLAGAQGAAGILGAGQSAGQGRVTAGGTLALGAGSQSLDRANGGMGALGGIDSGNLDRTMGYSTLAGAADAGRDSITGLKLQGAGAADNTSTQRGGLTLQGAGAADGSNLDRDKVLSGLAGGSDQTRLSGLSGYFGAAGGVDTFKDAQKVKILASQLGVDDATAGKILQFYQQGGTFEGDLQNTGLGAYGNAAGLGAQGGLAKGQLIGDIVKGGLSLAGGR